MARRIAIVLAVVLLVPVVLVGAFLVVVQSAWAERWVEARASAALHRDVQLDGIGVRLDWPPTVTFRHLRIANPEWAKTPALVDATDLSARVLVPPLFAGRVIVPYLAAAKATAGLEVAGEHATWKFGAASRGESRLRVARLDLGDGRIRYIDAADRTDLDIAVQGSAGAGGRLRAAARGTFRGAASKGSATIPHLDPQHESPIAFDGEATVGKTRAKAHGHFRTDGDALDVQLDLAGETMQELHRLFHMVLPDTPPYRVRGHLLRDGPTWTFSPFDGKVGDSDLEGGLTYRTGGKRPFLRAALQSGVLDMNDLGPIVGAPPGTGRGETASPAQRERSAEREARERFLPDARFHVERWNRMDADVRLEAKRVLRPKALPIDALSTHLVLKDAVLHLDPLDFGVAGGKLRSEVTIDARQRPVRGRLEGVVEGVQLDRLFGGASKEMRDALGTLYGRARLEGTGQSVAALLGTSDGHLTVAVNGGRVSDLLVNLLELDMADVLRLLGTRDRQVRLRCAVGGFEVKDGVAEPKPFVVDTTDSQVEVGGKVSLAHETIDLTAHPLPKDASLFSLRSPVDLRGPMRHPEVHVHKAPIAARVAGAALLGAVNPALALLAFVDDGPGKDSDCGRLMAEARRKQDR